MMLVAMADGKGNGKIKNGFYGFHSEVTQVTNAHISLAKTSHTITFNFKRVWKSNFNVPGSSDIRTSTMVGKSK